MKATNKPYTPYAFPKLVKVFGGGDMWVEPSYVAPGEVYLSLGGNGVHLDAAVAKRLAKALLKFAALKKVPKGAK